MRPKPTGGHFTDNEVSDAAQYIDQSGVIPENEKWQKELHPGPGGRPITFPTRSVAVAMYLAANTAPADMGLQNLFDVLFHRISPKMRRELGVPEPPDPDNRYDPELGPLYWNEMRNLYRRVRTRYHRMLEPMDPSVRPKNRRLPAAVYERRLAEAEQALPPEVLQTRHARLLRFVNQIIEPSIRMVDLEIWANWRGSVAVDGTALPAFARNETRDKETGMVTFHSANPDAGWYIREARHRDTEDPLSLAPSKREWAHELTLITASADDADNEFTFPYLVVGMGVSTQPGKGLAQAAIEALQNIRQRGHPAGWLAGDLLYNNLVQDTFQLPARAEGYDPVFDYRIDQLGVQASFGGALLVEGTWYCCCLPKELIEATVKYRKGRIGPAEWQSRIAARRPYALQRNGRPDNEGHQRLMCPAADKVLNVRCELKPGSMSQKTASKPRVFPPHDAVSNPAKICLQQSVIFPPEAGAKHRQTLPYASPEWFATYHTLRNTIEGFNGWLKDDAHEGLAAAQKRRIHGVAAQSVCAAFIIAAANIRKTETFKMMEVTDPDRSMRRARRVRRRQTKALQEWAPASA